ncbi:MAG: GNAT family N-acetyltransferase [Planctomycetaceae bacterium]|nr:GNAT family N-acetyltransferase [Planctomycetaceae bacterium]
MSVVHESDRRTIEQIEPVRTTVDTQPKRDGGEVWIDFVDRLEDVAAYRLDWDELCECCAEPNVFQSPWMLLPAWEQAGDDERLRFAFVYEQPPRKADPPVLLGVFPLWKQRGANGLPISVWQLWTHPLRFLNTPLVRAGHETTAVKALLDWVTESRSATAIEFGDIQGEGSFHRALTHLLDSAERTSFTVRRHCRAMIETGESFDEYMNTQSGHTRRELRRKRRKLEAEGQLELRVWKAGEDVEFWLTQFLELEVAGWKGREQTALAATEQDEHLFRRIVREAATRDQLDLLGLFLDDRPVALKCNFLMGRGGYAFKIAFDETYAKLSPGVLLELDNMRHTLDSNRLDWMDSCAVARHPMIDRLWKQRRVIETTLVSSGRLGSDALLAMYPLLRAVKREVRRLLPGRSH